jgi:hypothetical protein
VRRSNWQRMVTREAIIDKMNSITTAAIDEEEEVPNTPDVIRNQPEEIENSSKPSGRYG